MRERLPDDRISVTHKFSIAGQKGYFIVGLYDDGRPGELFIYMNKTGSVLSGLDGHDWYTDFNITATRSPTQHINRQTY